MRLLQMVVRDDRLEEMLGVLDEYQFGYALMETDDTQEGVLVVNVVLPADAVEHVLADLESAGFDRDVFTVSLKTEFAQFEHVDEVQNRWGKTPNKLSPQTLRSKAKDLRRNDRSYLWMMTLSAVVASAGLLLGSPAVIVGSMVIAPIVSPALTASVGAVRDDRAMLVDSIRMQGMGLGVAVLFSVVASWFLRQFHVVPRALAVEQMQFVSLRISPSLLAVLVGVSAGAAGAYGLATKGQATIVGVMIAAALIPTAAAVGIGLAWGNLVLAAGALLLLVLSLISVNVGSTAMLFYLEYRPDQVDDGVLDLATTGQALLVLGTGAIVVSTLLVSGMLLYQQSSFEHGVNRAVTDTLNQNRYENLGVRSTSMEFVAPELSEETVVSVTLTRWSDREYPEIADRIDRRITEYTDREVTVQLRYVDYRQSD